MKITTLVLIFALCSFSVLAKGKNNLATKAASLKGFPFSKEELKNIKPYDSKYYIVVSKGNISLKNKASNVRLFIMFYDKKSKKRIYTGNANFLFIAEKDKVAPEPITMELKKLCPS